MYNVHHQKILNTYRQEICALLQKHCISVKNKYCRKLSSYLTQSERTQLNYIKQFQPSLVSLSKTIKNDAYSVGERI